VLVRSLRKVSCQARQVHRLGKALGNVILAYDGDGWTSNHDQMGPGWIWNIIGGLGMAASPEESVGKGSSESDDGSEKRRSKLVNGVGTARQSGRGLSRWLLPHAWRRKVAGYQ
jgi:hypothetical protein